MAPEATESSAAVEKAPFSEDIWGTHVGLKQSPARRAAEKLFNVWDKPVTWFRETIVLPMRPATQPKYYHQRFRRVPTVEECYTDDIVCIYEAHEQYKRDRKVDGKIVALLRHRWGECMRYHGFDQAERCEQMKRVFMDAETNWFIKYGDVCMFTNCSEAYYKQVHRLIWERRHPEMALQTPQQ